MDNVQCWVCNGYGHYGKDCKYRRDSKGGGKDKGKNNKGGKKGDGKSKSGNNNKGKGYGGNATSSVDDAQPAGEPDPKDLAHLDLCAVDGGVGMDYGSSSRSEEENMGVEVEEDKPDYLVEYDGEEWIRFNYDSGAVSTVIPVEMAEEDLELHRVGEDRQGLSESSLREAVHEIAQDWSQPCSKARAETVGAADRSWSC